MTINNEILIEFKCLISEESDLSNFIKISQEKLQIYSEDLKEFFNICDVCRIFIHQGKPKFKWNSEMEYFEVYSLLKFRIHSGSMIDFDTLKRELNTIMYVKLAFPSFWKMVDK